ncbi:hypothetical protein M5226_004470 [Vibrio vulnificus]|nr:hypothetical protein [Vibrio vulnificus]
MEITCGDLSFSLSVAASLVAWAISSLVTGAVGYFITNYIIKTRYEKLLDESIKGTTKAIGNINVRISPKKDAKEIIKQFDIHIENYSSIKKIVSNEQIEQLRTLLAEPEPNEKKIIDELSVLRKTWESSVKSMYKAQKIFNKELGLKK